MVTACSDHYLGRIIESSPQRPADEWPSHVAPPPGHPALAGPRAQDSPEPQLFSSAPGPEGPRRLGMCLTTLSPKALKITLCKSQSLRHLLSEKHSQDSLTLFSPVSFIPESLLQNNLQNKSQKVKRSALGFVAKTHSRPTCLWPDELGGH